MDLKTPTINNLMGNGTFNLYHTYTIHYDYVIYFKLFNFNYTHSHE